MKVSKPKPPPPQTEASDVVSEIEARTYKKMQIPTFSRPKDGKGGLLNPKLPHSFSDLTDEALLDLYNDFSRMAQYVHQYLAAKNVQVAIARQNDRMSRARVRLSHFGTNAERDAKTDIDPEMMEIANKILLCEGTVTVTDSLLQYFLIGRETCSREMTRRFSRAKMPI